MSVAAQPAQDSVMNQAPLNIQKCSSPFKDMGCRTWRFCSRILTFLVQLPLTHCMYPYSPNSRPDTHTIKFCIWVSSVIHTACPLKSTSKVQVSTPFWAKTLQDGIGKLWIGKLNERRRARHVTEDAHRSNLGAKLPLILSWESYSVLRIMLWKSPVL